MSKFQPLFPSENKSSNSKTKRKTKKQLQEEKEAENKIIGKENLSKLDPMVIPLLMFHASKNKNQWLVDSAKAAIEKPHILSEKWINSLNKWASETSKAMSLDQPELEVGTRYDFEDLTIKKISPPKPEHPYPQYAIMAENSSGWKFYFKTSKATQFAVEDIISFKATVKGHEEGITFLSRASSLKTVIKIGDKNED